MSPLISTLRKRNLTLTAIARIIHPDRGPDLTETAVRRYLPHLSRHINGHEPIHRTIRGTQTLNPTWRRLRRVLTGEEFDAALAYALSKNSAQTPLTTEQQTATIDPL